MNRIDYNRLFEREAAANEGKKLLMHCCCAPCTLGAIEKVAAVFDVTLFWFNPNIMPEEEMTKRFDELKRIADIFGVKAVDGGYPKEKFLSFAEKMKNDVEGGARCRDCITLRLTETAKYASENGFDLFTTTLTTSPHKNSEFINKCGENIESTAKWLHCDFKKKAGFDRSTELCEKFDVYRQDYCGCKL